MALKPPVPDLITALRDALARLPGIEAQAGTHYFEFRQQLPSVDAELAIQLQGRPVRLLVQSRRNTSSRELREAVARLKPHGDSQAAIPAVPFIAAERIARRGREFLREQGIGYWDLSDSTYLCVPWAMYFVDHAALPESPRKRSNVYRGRASQVLHSLLLEPERDWHLNELAERSGTSSYVALQTCAYLEEQFWMERRGSGPNTLRTLKEPGLLLDAWAEVHSLAQYQVRRYYRWDQSAVVLRAAVMTVLEQAKVDYALTLASGAELVAAFSTSVERLSLLVQDSPVLEKVIESAGLRPVEDGENVAFLVTREQSPVLFRQRIENTWVASNIQIYLDLFAWPQRGKEQAKHLRAELLSY